MKCFAIALHIKMLLVQINSSKKTKNKTKQKQNKTLFIDNCQFPIPF